MGVNGETCFISDYPIDKSAKVELRNANVIDVEKGKSHRKGTNVIVQDGKILALQTSKKTTNGLTPDFFIDLEGKSIIPSLFNTHCHAAISLPTALTSFKDIKLIKKNKFRQNTKNMSDCVSRGVTNIRDAYTEDLRVIHALKKRIGTGEIPGPRILQSVVVGPPGSYLNEEYSFWVKAMMSGLGLPIIDRKRIYAGCVSFPVNASASQVRDAVNKAIDERGAETIKIGEQLENLTDFKPNSTIMKFRQLKALTDQARKRGVRTTIHHVSVDTFRRAIKAGVSSLAHVACDEILTQKDIDAFIAAGMIIEPTVSVSYDAAWKVKGDKWANHPEMEILTKFRNNEYTLADLAKEYYLPEFKETLQATNRNLNKGNFRTFGIKNLSGVFRYYSRMVGPGHENTRRLFNSGAIIGLGNDGGIPPCTPAMVALELRLQDLALRASSNGGKMDGKTALKIATINSAKAMGLEDRFGTIEKGKVADLVIYDGNPLKDYTLIGSPVSALFMDGKLMIDNMGLSIEPC